MKKAFSLVEVIISVAILSFVMITLFQIKGNNNYLLGISDEKVKLLDYILLAMDIDDTIHNKNESIFLDEIVNFSNDQIQKELKEIKIDIKDKEEKEVYIELEDIRFKVKTFISTYEIENKIKKGIYTFEVSF